MKRKGGTGFVPPNQQTREKAIGAAKAAQHDYKLKAFLKKAESSGLFPPINDPKPGDWLRTYNEQGQPAPAYINRQPRIGGAKKKVYIQPLGSFLEHESPSLDTLQDFATRYLCMEVEVLAPIELVQSVMDRDNLMAVFPGATGALQWQCDVCEHFNDNHTTKCEICDCERMPGMTQLDKKRKKQKENDGTEKKKEKGNATQPILTDKNGRRALQPKVSRPIEVQSRMNMGARQLLTGDVEALMKQIKPKDAYCIIAITMDDLYPGEDWNFVFGEADPADRVGVFSFARYSPYFYSSKKRKPGTPLSPAKYSLLLRRSCAVMVHEIIHLFDVEESDSQPLYLCPVEIHKLSAFHHRVLKNSTFDIEDRYKGLLEFYRSNTGFEEDALWIQKVLDTLFGKGDEGDNQEREKEKEAEGGEKPKNGKKRLPEEKNNTEKKVKEENEGREKEKEAEEKPKSAKREKEKDKEKEAVEEEVGVSYPPKRINVAPKGNPAKKKVIIVSSLQELKEAGGMKLLLSAKKRKEAKVFTSQGERISSFKQIQEDDIVFLG